MTTRCWCGALKWVSLGIAALAALALAFSLFATALWAPEVRPSGLQSVVLARGSVTVTCGNYINFAGSGEQPARWKVFRGTPSTYHWQWSPLYRYASMADSSQFIFPLWIPAAAFGALAAWQFSRGQPRRGPSEVPGGA